MIGRVRERRATSVNPALRNAEARPVQANVAGIVGLYGSTGYASAPRLGPARRNRRGTVRVRMTTTRLQRCGFGRLRGGSPVC